MNALDLEKLKCYAARIRVLEFNSALKAYRPSQPVSYTAYSRLLAAISKPVSNWGSTALLPGLQRLEIHIGFLEHLTSYAALLLCPYLSVLTICGATDGEMLDDHVWNNFLGVLQSSGVARELKQFNVRLTYGAYPEIDFTIKAPSRLLTYLVQNCITLTELNLDAFQITDPDILSFFSHLVLLETLSIDITEFDPANLKNIKQVNFVVLKNINITGKAASTITDILAKWNAAQLESVVIKRQGHMVFWDLDELFKNLGRILPRKTLQALVICNNASHDLIDTNVSIVEFDTVEPLFRFANLKIFCINIGAQFILDDDGLLEIAATWPNLFAL